jgi:hypothetical protein
VGELLDAAEHYAVDMGWPVVPLVPRTKEPATRRGFLEATVDVEQIRRWWRATPRAGIGISCERVVVLDIDTKKGAPGRESLAALVADCGELPETWRARTPSGGEHFYFARGGHDVRRKRGARPGIDVCGLGGYAVAPPTWTEANPSKNTFEGFYEWTAHDVLAACPAWVAALAPPPSAETAPVVESCGRWADVMPRAERAARYVDKMPPAISGSGGHGALWRVALVLVRGFELPRPVALEVLKFYNRRCEPPWSLAALEHKLNQAERANVPMGFVEGRP